MRYADIAKTVSGKRGGSGRTILTEKRKTYVSSTENVIEY
jgi:hypothetical protein